MHLANAARERADMNQRVDQNKLYLDVNLGGLPYSRAELQQMTTKLIMAMAAAIRAGFERPPRVGIDPTPGTKNPTTYVRARR
jgi:hypothetical protein